MKTIKITLVALVAMLGLSSCEPEDICGTVTGHSVEVSGYQEYYYLYVDGNKRGVTLNTWLNYSDGSSICLD